MDVGSRSIDAYERIAPDGHLDALREIAKDLKGARISSRQRDALLWRRVGASPFRVPLLRDLGLAADWKIISGDRDVLSVTKTIHNRPGWR